jgi:signal transduction histidine kinase
VAEPKTFDQGVEEVISLLTRRDGAHRIHFLELACDLLPDGRCMAAVWIWDPDTHQLTLNRHYSPLCDDERPRPLRRRRAECRRGSAVPCDPKPESWTLELESQPEILSWCQGLGLGAHEYKFPIITSPEKDRPGECLGFLQVVTAAPMPGTTQAVMPHLATGLAAAIVRTREHRQLEVLRMVQAGIDLTRPVKDYLREAAQALHKTNWADLCLVFRQERGLGMKVLTAWPQILSLEEYVARPGSLAHLIAQRKITVRMGYFRDEGERRRVFGTDQYDTELFGRISQVLHDNEFHAWLAAPVIVGDHAIAVIMLVNRRDDLAEQFTKTDEEVLGVVCRHLAGVLPGVETYQAMKRMSETILANGLKEERSRRQLFDLLTDLIPGVACAAVIRSGVAEEPPTVLHLGGEHWFARTLPPAEATVDVSPFAGGAADARAVSAPGVRWQFALEIPSLEEETGWLVLGLLRDYLDNFEKQVLAFFCAELSQVLRSERLVTKSLEDFVQIRHAVRSGLAPVVGHVHVALGCYEIYRKLGHPPSCLLQARFRKALNFVASFAKKTQILLEESRFLLGQINRQSLRIGGGSIGGLVRDVVAGLRPYAAEREIEIQYVNRVPDVLDRVDMDHQLVEMLVFNLIENAVKYAHRGRDVLVEVATRGRDWTLGVTDRGTYIHPEDCQAIFQPFIRRPTGSAATTRPGTGLGLAVAKAVVEVHGGRIDVESDLISSEPEPFALTRFVARMPRKIPREEGR